MRLRSELVAYALLSAALMPVPLLNVLHVESAAVVAGVAFFVAGWGAVGRFAEGAQGGDVVVEQEAALLLPLAALTITQLWAPNCAYATGVLVYALFPGITVLLAVGAAYAVTGWTDSPTRARWILAGAGIAVAVIGPLYDLGLHPQFYTYNHVFGGVLGPIYDEQLAFRTGLFVFRGITLLWAGALWSLGTMLRRPGVQWAPAAVVTMCLVAASVVYALPARTGINTTEAHLRRSLGGHVQTQHFDLYYDPAVTARHEAEALASDHEAEYARMARRLGVDGDTELLAGRVQSFVYPSPDVKARLTGARTTSVSPVWLSTPQVHLLRSRVEGSFSHELAHVFSRPYGLPVVRATWAVGLVEGWAVALEAPTVHPSPHDLVSASAFAGVTGVDAAGSTALDTGVDGDGLAQQARGIASRLSPWGFWTGRGAVSYATMGSFTTYLLDAYGPGPLKRVYARADFEAVYGKSVTELAREWAAFLRGREVVSAAAYSVVQSRFTRPSLFETTCPHYVPAYRRQWQEARRAVVAGDTSRAMRLLARSLAEEPRFAAAHVDLARLRLTQGEATAARDQLDTLTAGRRTPAALRTLADAHALLGDSAAAESLYADARAGVSPVDPDRRTRVLLRHRLSGRPDAIRILTSGDSAAVQARRLEAAGEDPALHAWAALRWQEAYRFDDALRVWRSLRRPDGEEEGPVFLPILPSGTPRGWAHELDAQLHTWTARAALRAGDAALARRLAARAARLYRRYGHTAAARVLDVLRERTEVEVGPGT